MGTALSGNCMRQQASSPLTLAQRLVSRGMPSLKATLIFVLSLILLLLTQSPLEFFLPSTGLDASWAMVLNFAAERHESFGRDIIFSLGPLGFIYGRLFSEPLLIYKLAFDCFFAVSFSLLLARYTDGAKTIVLIVCLFVSLEISHDATFFTFMFLFATTAVWSERQGADLDLMLAAAVIGAIILIKLSFIYVAVPAVLLSDLHRLRRHRFPTFTLIMLFAAVSCFMYFSTIGDVGAFLRASYEIVAGYADGASVYGPPAEVLLYLVATLLVAGLMSSIRAGNPHWELVLYRTFVLWTMFVAFKVGFTRHDFHHSVTAWSFVGSCAAIVLFLPGVADGPRFLQAGKLALAPVLAIAGHVVYALYAGMPFGQVALSQFFDAPAARFAEIGAAITHPKQWLHAKVQASNNSLQAIGQSSVIPKVDGSIDIIPSQQSDLLALGLRYHHRPVFQEYLAYTPYLIRMNESFFEGPSAPSLLLMRPDTIDNRWPASAEGALWPLFFARYEPVEESGRFIVLHRREDGALSHLQLVDEKRTTFGEPVLVPSEQHPLVVQIKIRSNLWGQLVGLAFKRSQISIRATLQNGRITEQRLIPAMAQTGFLLSPYVETAREYGAVAAGLAGILGSKQVTKIEIKTSALGRLQYEPEIEVSFFRVADIPSAPPEFKTQIMQRYRYLSELMKGQSSEPPLGLINDGLFAHAPRELMLKDVTGGWLKFRYGILNGAWETEDPTDGVCFRVEAIDSANEHVPVWENCLDPVHNVSDREVKSAQIKLVAGWKTLVFATLCKNSCSSDWSYWSDIDIGPSL